MSSLLGFVCYAQSFGTNVLAKPSNVQLQWQNMEELMFVHFGPATWQNHEYDDLSTPLSKINPKKLNTDQWATVAKSFGAKMIIFVAKHTGGFCWWQTNTTAYSVKNIPWKNGKGDVMSDLEKSCKKYGLKLGVYLSPEDRYLNVGMGGVARNPKFQAKYEKIYKEQLTELLTRYGEISEVWVDGSLVFDIHDLLKKYAAKAVILQSSAATIRWVGNELGIAPYPIWNAVNKIDARSGNATADHGTPFGDVWLPVETDVSIRKPFWFWSTTNANQVLTLNQLLQIYYCSVGRGTNLLISTCPDTTGLIPHKDAAVLAALGGKIKSRFLKPVAFTQGVGKVITLLLPSKQWIDNMILMEDIRYGQRILSFKLEGLTSCGWKEIFTGTSIGHKLIVQFPAFQTTKVRLLITKSLDTPRLKKMEAFYTKTKMVTIPHVGSSWKIRSVGEWNVNENSNTANLNLELSPYCKDAQTYEVAFVVTDKEGNQPKFTYDWANTGLWLDDILQENRLKIESKHLILDGVNADHYFIDKEKFSDRLLFNLTGIAPTIQLKVKLYLPKGMTHRKILAFLLRK
jgi:alpha-L-fucosidase